MGIVDVAHKAVVVGAVAVTLYYSGFVSSASVHVVEKYNAAKKNQALQQQQQIQQQEPPVPAASEQ
eukprot:m.78026 g.78026  ORF g.78026 m.78026 type:complete len:66 (+) comp14570_c0_seq1:49-246(+)